MTPGSERVEESKAPERVVETSKSASLRAPLRMLVVLVICGGVLFWAFRVVWDSRNPLLATARSLKARQPTDRLDAVGRLTEMGLENSKQVIPYLIEAALDPDARLRAAAAKSLGLVGSYATMKGADKEPVREAVAALFPLLKDQEPTVRIEALQALCNLSLSLPGGGGGKKGGGETPKSEVDLGQLGSSCTELLSDPDSEVRLAALRGLAPLVPKLKIEPPKALILALEDKEATNRAAAIGALAAFPKNLDPIIPIVLKSLGPDEPSEVRAAGLQALGTIKPAAISLASVPALVAAIANPLRDVRFELLSLLAKLGRDCKVAALPAFIAGLKEPIDTDQREFAGMFVAFGGPVYVSARAVGQVAPATPSAPQAIQSLTALVESGHPQRGAAGAGALGAFGPAAAAAVPGLIKLLGTVSAIDVPTRDGKPIAEALAQIAPKTPAADDAVKALTAALAAPSEHTREAAAKALAEFRTQDASSAIPALRELLKKEPDAEVRTAAETTLKKIGGDTK
jgi:HEAT repeat protein